MRKQVWTLSLLLLSFISASAATRQNRPENRLERKPLVRPKPISILPTSNAAILAQQQKQAELQRTGFHIYQRQGRLFLLFSPGTPAKSLLRRPPFLVQLEGPSNLKLQPDLIMLPQWPNTTGRAEIEIKIAGAIKGKTYPIRATGVMTVCDSAKKCSRLKSQSDQIFTP